MLGVFPARFASSANGVQRSYARGVVAIALLGCSLATGPAAAQWLGYATAGVPRKADGTVDMAAPTPRLADGKPDFSGIWATASPNRQGAIEDMPSDGNDIGASRQMANIGVDLPGGLPYQPWLVPIVKERTDNLGDRRSAYPLLARQLPARLRAAAHAQVHPHSRASWSCSTK